MTDEDIARQVAANPDSAPDMAPEIDVRRLGPRTQGDSEAIIRADRDRH
jgi:hypothetical protein